MKHLPLIILLFLSANCFSQQIARYAFMTATAEPSEKKIATAVFPIDMFVKDFDGSYKMQTELKSKVCALLETKAKDSIPGCTFIVFCALFVHDEYFSPHQDTVFITKKAAQDDLDKYMELFKANESLLPIIKF